jgi:E3 ubiquitin-protein ligase BRE1
VGASESQLEDMILTLNRLLKCPICTDRYKNRIIVGDNCNHMFCHVCVDKRIAARNRKCPGCGQGFAQSQVHVVAGLEP